MATKAIFEDLLFYFICVASVTDTHVDDTGRSSRREQMPVISAVAIRRSVLLVSTSRLYLELPKGVSFWGDHMYTMWGHECLTREGNVLSAEFSNPK